MIVLWLLWSCGSEDSVEDWDVLTGLEPVLMRMDGDDDGLVGPEEYRRHAWRALDFDAVDGDSDQSLSAEELRRLLRSEDVQRFDDLDLRRPVNRDVWAEPFSDPPGERMLWELLRFLDEELRFADTHYRSPAYEDMVRAAGTGRLDSQEVSTLMSYFANAYDELGWSFPVQLLSEVEGD